MNENFPFLIYCSAEEGISVNAVSFDYIEDLIEQENTFTEEKFAVGVNEFPTFRRYDILKDKGSVSTRRAVAGWMRSTTPSIRRRRSSLTSAGRNFDSKDDMEEKPGGRRLKQA